MFNHLQLANLISPVTISSAISAYHKRIKECKNPNKVFAIREYLINLNKFLYAYFLIKYNKDLEELAVCNEVKIESKTNPKALIAFGETMIKNYSDSLISISKSSNHAIVNKALDIINENYRNRITLKEISESLDVSNNYLCTIFKAETGYKFCDYVNLLKVNRAMELIKKGKSFDFISDDCGFSSQAHFSITFKKYTGITPKDYKSKIKL